MELLTPEEKTIGDRFLEVGHLVVDAEDLDALSRIRQTASRLAADFLGVEQPYDIGAFLDGISTQVDPDRLNELRLSVINGLNTQTWFRPAYYSLVRSALTDLVGNELAMQRRINLSIQLPNDDSSLLPVHADVWDGDSPFEVVVWVPLVDCYRSKSMYLLEPPRDREVQSRLHEFGRADAEDIFQAVADDVTFIDIAYGQVLIFSLTLMHGNRINEERETRWSMNCRFKSVMSPYADKKLGEFFEPITLRPATRMGLDYQLPGEFDG